MRINNNMLKAYIISIGDELLIGQVVDSNSAYIADKLTEIGVEVRKVIKIKDEEKEIIDALDYGTDNADIVIATGGLGPTVDDITKKSFAKFLNVPMEFNQEFHDKVKEYVTMRGGNMDELLFEYSHFPKGTKFLTNNVGSAPGMVFYKNDTTIISMPGVPSEMKDIFENEALTLLKQSLGSFYISKKTILTSGELEAVIAQKLITIVDNFPENMSIAYLPNHGRVRVRLMAKGEDKSALDNQIREYTDKIEEVIGDLVFGYDDELLESAIGKLLQKQNFTLGTAESCTGGNIASKITSISGSSQYYVGSVVAYSNDVKRKILGVKEKTLEDFGAVSENTVIEMVKGTLKTLNCDYAIATSGIAGPTGGTEEKPVGTIWLACGNKDKIVTKKLQLGNNRQKNIETSSVLALDILRRMLVGV